jgi:hypothetical protein
MKLRAANTSFGYDNAGRMNYRSDLPGLTTTRAFDTSNGELQSEAIKQGATTVASFSRQVRQEPGGHAAGPELPLGLGERRLRDRELRL